MMLPRFIVSVFFVLCYFPSIAGIVKGTIVDENKMPIPFATILVQNSSLGTSANYDGEFLLDLQAGKYTIQCKAIGFQSKSATITLSNEPQVLNFQLLPQKLSLKDVVISVKKEDPAYAIMRKVIAKRKFQASLVKTLETDIYLKGTIRTKSFPDQFLGIPLKGEDFQESLREMGIDSNGKGVVYLLEQMTHYSYKAPNKEFNEVLSVRQSGDPKGLGFATMPPIINIYENQIQILNGINERGFISPANSNAFHYYNYKFLGTFLEDDRLINKIKITPKRKYEPLFSGYLYVVEDDWVFHSVDLMLTKESQINVVDTLWFSQNYRLLAENIWIIQSQVHSLALSILGIDLTGNFLTSYSHSKLNQSIPDSRFTSKVISVYDSSALEKKATYWDTIRPIPLTTEEKNDFKFKDSLFIVNEKQDTFNNSTQIHYNFVTSEFRFKKGKNFIFTRPLITSVSFNSIEGLNLTLDVNYNYTLAKGKDFYIQLLNRYGFANHHYNSLAKVGILTKDQYWKEKSWQWQIQGGKYVYQINPKNPISPFMNSLYTLFLARNYMKLFENQLIKFNLARNWGNGWDAALAVSYEHRIPLFNASDFTFAQKHDDRISPNDPPGLPKVNEEDAALVSAKVSYQPGWQYILYPKEKMPVSSNQPKFSISYTKGIPKLWHSQSNFDQWRFDVLHQFKLKMLGKVNYRLETGGFLNSNHVNLPDYKHLNGNQTFFISSKLESFQLPTYYRFSNIANHYFQGHFEWHMGGLFTNKIPLFRKLNWFLLAGANSFYVNQKDYYYELFVGMENIGFKMFRFGRVDFIAGFEPGMPKPNYGFRLSFSNIFENLFQTSGNKEL